MKEETILIEVEHYGKALSPRFRTKYAEARVALPEVFELQYLKPRQIL